MPTLKQLWAGTSFAKDFTTDGELPAWSGTSTDDEELPFVPELSYFGNTLICLSDTYQEGREDCKFLEDLVRAWIEGRLTERET